MSESEWLESSDPEQMLGYLRDTSQLSERKARLFEVACCRRIWPLITHEAYRNLVEVAERFADGQADRDQMKAALRSAYDATRIPDRTSALWAALHTEGDCVVVWPGYDVADTSYYYAAYAVAIACGEAEERPIPVVSYEPFEPATAVAGPFVEAKPTPEAMKAEYRAQTGLLRDMFGNPFRPVAIDPSWLTPQVVRLAQEIYAQRSFERMPELATLLERAGCANAGILAHCKEGGEHVRGCWVLDLILSKDR